jgi:hypothetical protein
MPKLPMHLIEVDDKIFIYLQKHAEPLIDTPNTVLYRLLLNENYTNAPKTSPSLKLTGLPKALSQPLEVLYEISKHGLTRPKATKLIAEKHNTVPSSVMDKYCKQLDLKARDIDLMLEEPGYEKFMNLLKDRFPDFASIIDMFFETLYVEE